MPKPKTRLPRTKATRTKAADASGVKSSAPAKKATPPARVTTKARTQKSRNKKSGRPNILVRWWNETRGELRKVVWPTWAEVRYLTAVVLLVTFLTSVFFGVADWVFLRVVGFLIGI